jgi:hypothetical protein
MSIRNLIRATQLLAWLLEVEVPTAVNESGVAYNPLNIFLPLSTLFKKKVKARDRARTTIPKARKLDFEDFEFMIRKQKEKMRNALIMSISVCYMFQLPSAGHVAAGKSKENFREKFRQEVVSAWSAGQDSNRKHSIRYTLGWGETDFGIKDAVKGRDLRCEEWDMVLKGSLEHLWSYALIPKGLARTNALMENFYTIILAGENRIPLLITGPPGCGKTLSFSLVCDNLRGPCLHHSVAFQHLRKARKIMYQCSVTSTGQEIASRFKDAALQQEILEQQQPGKHLVSVGVDEAGLTPENRQALKSLHDILG